MTRMEPNFPDGPILCPLFLPPSDLGLLAPRSPKFFVSVGGIDPACDSDDCLATER
jgi:hypothetical protein